MQMNENMRTIYANMKAKTDEIKKIPVDDEHEETLKTALDELDEAKVINSPVLIEGRPKQLTAPELVDSVEVELIDALELDEVEGA